MKSSFLSALLQGTLLILLSVSPGFGAAKAPLKVFVSIEPLRYLAEQVGGDQVDVEVMIAPGENPATFSPSPRKMARLKDAQLFFHVGVPSEAAWLPRVRESYPDIKLIDVRSGITLRRQAEKGHDHPHHSELDPHVWNSPVTSIQIGANMRDALIEADPAHRAIYTRNFERLADTLHALDRNIATMLKTMNPRRFMVFHPSWGYFADRYGLQQIAIEKQGKSPGIRQLGKLIEQARSNGIKTIIVQPQFSRRDAQTIAHEIGGQVVAVDPLAYDIPAALRHLAQILASDQAGTTR